MSNIVTWPYRLVKGHTDNPADGACAMAAVAHLTTGERTDAPSCVAPVLRSFIIPANDAMDDATRQRFLPYLHRIAGSVDPDAEARRSRILAMAALRIFAPRALDAAGSHEHAQTLRALADDVGMNTAAKAAQAASWAAPAAWAATDAAAWAAKAQEAKAQEAKAAAEETQAASWAGWAAAWAPGAWDDYFAVLDAALSAGKQGEPWSVDTIDVATAVYASVGGLCVTA